jgi:3-oxoadipate enol-lactonase
MPKVNLEDVTIHYEDVGQGHTALVFCHGLGGIGRAEFIEEARCWQKRFGRVLTWDARGLGDSSQAKKYSLQLYASDLARLMHILEIRNAILFGYLWGGILTLQFALDYPEMCAGIILDSSASEVNVTASEIWYQRGEHARIGPNSDSIKPEHLDSYVASARAVARLREHPITPRLKEIACPSLIIAGGQDHQTGGPGASVIMSRNLPNSQLQIYQEAGHGIWQERPVEFRALVLEFCAVNGIISR